MKAGINERRRSMENVPRKLELDLDPGGAGDPEIPVKWTQFNWIWIQVAL